MRKVNVMISTYNGEKYIKEQIDSILSQSYPEVSIYVRDDGSKDATLSILQEYERKGKITLFSGNNIGYGKSFLTLLQFMPKEEYYAFCDQDDIWCSDKLESAVHWLDKEKGAAMYHGSFYNTNEQMEIIDTYGPPKKKPTFQRTITHCIHLGFSMVFNDELRELVMLGKVDNLVTHDWWTELVAMEFATIYFDEKIGTYHRRLDSSVSAMSFSARWKWFLRALKKNAEISTCTAEFMRVFGKKAEKKHIQVISWFASEKYHLRYSLCKAFYPHRWRPSVSSELVVRFLMLIGKI